MSKSLEEFFEQHEATRFLVNNLEANLKALTDLDDEEKAMLMRCNLIMIRQCLMDFGVE
jgi:hypothetical protein